MNFLKIGAVISFILGVSMTIEANIGQDFLFQGLSKAKILTAGIALTLIGLTLYRLSRRLD